MDSIPIPIYASESHHFFDEFHDTLLNKGGDFCCIRAGFAFATVGGVEQLMSHFDGIDDWAIVDKQFLIGIHHAITEPRALELLRGIPRSEVRIVIPRNRLTLTAFEIPPVFHPKLIAIADRADDSICFLQTGSANMTSAAIGISPRNHEFGVAIKCGPDEDVIDGMDSFSGWWNRLWGSSRVVDRKVIRQYATLRKGVLRENPILKAIVDAPKSIGEAENFFCEVGAASGPPGLRHQIEFPVSLAGFFGPVHRGRRDLTLTDGRKTWRRRPLSYKTTTFNVEIWRLGMPTQHTGGVPIADRAIKFTRLSGLNRFQFEVMDVGTDEYDEWVTSANLDGHLGATHGVRQRQYGFY